MSNQFVVSLATVELILASVIFFDRVPDRARSFAGAASPERVPGFLWPALEPQGRIAVACLLYELQDRHTELARLFGPALEWDKTRQTTLRKGLRALPAQLDDFVARATKARWSARQILKQLAQEEIAQRWRRSLERRLRLSGLKSFKPMADFDWSWPTQIERDVIERALSLDFVSEARNLVLVGRNGLGKTMIAQNICHAAVLAGYSVLFRPAAALLEELHRQSPQGRRHKLCTYANIGLLCIDEVGYLSFDDKAADLLYQVVNRRYERKSVIVTTHRPFKEWNQVFPTATCIVTLLDRLLHHADVTVIEGNSYRLRESEQETAERRKKKK